MSDPLMSDPLETMFDEFADVAEKSILAMSEQLRGFRAELDLIRQEQRSALVQAATSAVEGRTGPPGHDGLDGRSVSVFEQANEPKGASAGDIWIRP